MAKIKIYNKEIEYDKVYRHIKYPRLEFKSANLLLVLPKRFKDEKELIKRHRVWIYKKSNFIDKCLMIAEHLQLNLEVDLENFKDSVYQIVENLSNELNVEVNKVYLRKMKTKWGSCSSNGNITINTLLRFLPLEFIEYIILHELIHRIHRKHNKEFYGMIEKRFENPSKIEERLFAYWFLINKSHTFISSVLLKI